MDNYNLEDKDRVTYFGLTDFRGNAERFGIKAEDRTRHTYVIGKTGMGKSTMLENMAIQDIQNGEGLCFVDPHGTTAEKLLKYVPPHRMNDVVYFAPFDTKYPFALNILEHVDEDYRHLVASGLMDTFKKVFGEDVFSGRMVYLLNNAILSLLENEGESLMGINRIYADKDYRKKIIANVKDPAVISFWRDEFAKYEDKYVKEATAAIQNKIGQFIMTPMVRNIVGQRKTSFDLRKIMDERKILICNFSIGQTGSENVNLIGSLLITKIYLAAMSRANLSYDELQKAPPFYFYVDEFQNFVNDSFAQILSQARKYNLGLTIAHQYIEQLTDNVKAAVFGNVGTLIVFRVGATDAEMLEKEFAPNFTIDDIVNLGSRQIYLRLSIDGVGSKPFSARTLPPIESSSLDIVPAIVASSRAQFGKEKKDVEEEIMNWYQPIVIDRPKLASGEPSNQAKPRSEYLGNTQNKSNSYERPRSDERSRSDERLRTSSAYQRPSSAAERLQMKSVETRRIVDKPAETSREVEKAEVVKKEESSNNSLRDALSTALKLKQEDIKPRAESPKHQSERSERNDIRKEDKGEGNQEVRQINKEENAMITPQSQYITKEEIVKIMDLEE